MDPKWVRNLYGFALKPDAVLYLRIGVENLIPRVVFSHGFDYWESGMDLQSSEDMYDSFCKYQTALMAQFGKLADEYNFEVVDASQPIEDVFRDLRDGIRRVMAGESQLSTPVHDRKLPDGILQDPSVADSPAVQPRGIAKGGD
jgi:dTMP kinase